MSSDNIIPFNRPTDSSPVELPSDVENTESNQELMPPPPPPPSVDQRRQEMLYRLIEFLNVNEDNIDSFIFMAQVRHMNGNGFPQPCYMSSPMTISQEAFMVSSVNAVHSKRMLGLWDSDA